jgi:hypothetical protein
LDFTNVLMPDDDHWILFVIHSVTVSG